MQDVLRKYIAEVLASEAIDYRTPTQLRSPDANNKKSTDSDKDKETEKEMDENNVVANIVGFTGPAGASSADMGADPVKPGGKLKKKKKDFIRWK